MIFWNVCVLSHLRTFQIHLFSTINPHINIFQNSNIFRKGPNWGELGATAHSFIPPIHCNATKQQYCKWGSHILWELRVKLALLTMIFYYIKNLLVNFSWFYECCYKKLSFCSCMKVLFHTMIELLFMHESVVSYYDRAFVHTWKCCSYYDRAFVHTWKCCFILW